MQMHIKILTQPLFMQEILEAYRVLSNPEKRRKYNQETFGETERVFKTFTLTPENEEENTGSFVTYWNMSNQLRTILNKSIRLMKQETQKKTLTQRVFQKWGKYQKKKRSAISRSQNYPHRPSNILPLLKWLEFRWITGVPMQ